MIELLKYLYWLHSEVNPKRKECGLKNVPLIDAIKSYKIMKNFSNNFLKDKNNG